MAVPPVPSQRLVFADDVDTAQRFRIEAAYVLATMYAGGPRATVSALLDDDAITKLAHYLETGEGTHP